MDVQSSHAPKVVNFTSPLIAFLSPCRCELWVLELLDWKMRIVTPLDPLSHLGVILNLADPGVDAPAAPSILERASTFVAVSVTQSGALDFRPLVVASAAVLAAWAQVGDMAAVQKHLRTLVEVSGAQDEEELLRCKRLLNAGFNQKMPQVAGLGAHQHLRQRRRLRAPPGSWEWEARQAHVELDKPPFTSLMDRSPAY